MGNGRQVFLDRGLRAKRSFGQCFLADANIARRMARECVLVSGATVLEIGPGTGALTEPLLDLGARVVAIERDREMIPVLREALSSSVRTGQLTIHELDAATCDWANLLQSMPRPHVIVGNVPYQITGRLLERATAMAGEVQRVVFMIQKEVAERIEAPCGSRDYGALSVFVRRSFHVVRRFGVPPTCFRPQPSVHSAVVVFEPNQPVVGSADDVFRELVRAAFARRRKTIRNAWRGAMGFDDSQWERAVRDVGLRMDARPETLSVDDFARVAGRVRALRGEC